MGNNGLDISDKQFMTLGAKERDLMLFRNVVHIRKQFKDYKLNKKIQYVWLALLTIFVGVRRFLGGS